MWTADVALAARADAAGIDRIGVDLDRLGKAERQRGLGTWISPHTLDDLRRITEAVRHAQGFARINPPHPGSAAEIEAAVAAGAQVVMLPMVANALEAAAFADAVAGRATTVLLVERVDALLAIEELAAVPGIDEIHLGINDLAISMGLRCRWLTLAGELATEAGRTVRAAGLRFGLGALARPRDEALPVPADLIYAECARSGATAALLSRSFFADDGADLTADIDETRARLASWRRAGAGAQADAHRRLAAAARRSATW